MRRLTVGDVVVLEGERFTGTKTKLVEVENAWMMYADDPPETKLVTEAFEGTLEVIFTGNMVLDNGQRISIDSLRDIQKVEA